MSPLFIMSHHGLETSFTEGESTKKYQFIQENAQIDIKNNSPG
jgi:hypothetical protein